MLYISTDIFKSPAAANFRHILLTGKFDVIEASEESPAVIVLRSRHEIPGQFPIDATVRYLTLLIFHLLEHPRAVREGVTLVWL